MTLSYVVVGDGDDRARLQNLAAERGVAERVRFVGVLGQDVLVDAYRMADLFVMPSSGEGFRHRLSGSHGLRHARAWPRRRRGGRCIGRRRIRNHGVGGRVRAVLARLLASPKPDPHALAAAVRARFGHAAFARQVRTS